MADYGIVGMGLVHVKNPIFAESGNKSSSCDLECSFSAQGKASQYIFAIYF